MSIELDHLFVCVANDGLGAARLTEFGLTEGTPNTHPGQGTACRRFFFRNIYLELLWVEHPAAAQSDLVRPLRLWERWQARNNGACPFGFVFRPTAAGDGTAPFRTWPYRPPYLPAPLSFAIGDNVDLLTEPLLVVLPSRLRPGQIPTPTPQPREHPAGMGKVTTVELVSPFAERPSQALQALIDADLLRVRRGTEFHVKLAFDNGSRGRQIDLRPTLPLTFGW